MFMLFYDSATRKVSAMNGSGRAGGRCTLAQIRKDLGVKEGEVGKIPISSIHAVTVPGAAAGWVDAVERLGSGKVSLEDVLAPAIALGEDGFVVSELTGAHVSSSSSSFSAFPFPCVGFRWVRRMSESRELSPPCSQQGMNIYVRRIKRGAGTAIDELDDRETNSCRSLLTIKWTSAEPTIRKASPNFSEMLKRDPLAPDGVRAPKPGEFMKNPTLAQTFRELAKDGKPGFYTGRVATELVRVVNDLGGHLTLEDMAHHLKMGSEDVEAISLKFTGQGLGYSSPSPSSSGVKRYANGEVEHAGVKAEDKGLEVWEHPPNGQGIVALMALGILQELEKKGKIPRWKPEDFNTAPYLHAIIEALRLAFSDGSWYVTDPNVVPVPSQGLISSEYLSARAELFSPDKAMGPTEHGNPPPFLSPALQSSDTVYFSVTDARGNACSFINSNYRGFGTCIIPRGCGFTLQNRGANFSLDENHPNVLAPGKRPYHTIIPGLVTNGSDGSLHSIFGVMEGFMQPQGHVQVLLGQLVGRLDPQRALDAPRVCIRPETPDSTGVPDWRVDVEDGMDDEVVQGLKKLGHQVQVVKGMKRGLFGRGQIIRYSVDKVEGCMVWSAGSDMRGDGAAYPL